MKRDHAKTCILGAGLTGLSTAYHWPDDDYLVVEKASQVGGNCRTEEMDGFQFDSAGHIFYPKQAYTRELVHKLLGDTLREADRDAWIYSHDTYTRYPFQSNLYGLPPDVIGECLQGLHDAKVQEARDGETVPANFLDFIYRTFGAGIAKHFMIPFNNKHWRVPLEQLTLDWMGQFVPRPSFEQVLTGTIRPAKKCIGQNATFWYPDVGGIQAISNMFLPHISAVQLNAALTSIDLSKKTLEIGGREKIGYERVISTLPLPVLVGCLNNPPSRIKQAARQLRWNSLSVVNVAVDKPTLTDKHRIYVPDPQIVFHKLAFCSAYAPLMAPPGKCSVAAEVAHSIESPGHQDALVERVIEDLKKLNILSADDKVLFTHVIEIPYAYAIYDKHRGPASTIIRDYFATHDVHCWGRYAEWEYQNMERNILTGQSVAAMFGGRQTG